MNSKSTPRLPQVFEKWRAEDRDLESVLDDLRDWMQEVNQLGIPHFGETGTRLGEVRDRLVQHFEREDEMIAELAKFYPDSSPEIGAIRRHASLDHSRLLARLHDLIGRLGQLEPPFESWEAAMDEVQLFVVVLEQHEDQESESVEMLMPGGSEE